MVQTQTISNQRQHLRQCLELCRQGTLQLFDRINYETFCRQAHPDFSPIGWHLGHIAYIEANWILGKFAGLPSLKPEYNRLFAADSLPKAERVNLPTFEQVCDYLDLVRDRVFRYLELAPLEQQSRMWHWLIQHESQHCETISLVLEMLRLDALSQQTVQQDPQSTIHHDLIEISAGYFEQGSDTSVIDNEIPIHQVYLGTYWIDRYPVTRGQYRQFMEAGGYSDRSLWTESGWQWLQSQVDPIHQPLYWKAWNVGDRHPVCGVNRYEAEAYARFVGMRLPTEAEWEKAASWHPELNRRQNYPWGESLGEDLEVVVHCNCDRAVSMTTSVDYYPQGKSLYGCYDMLGNVWEWTASAFQPYPGFVSYPYHGYSSSYFDHQHFVLRGGSWTTRPWSLRNSFRNWYHPHVRQILAGFRCASSVQ